MSLKRRNILAWALLLIAAVSWVFGRQLWKDGQVDSARATEPATTLVEPVQPNGTLPDVTPPEENLTSTQVQTSRGNLILGAVLCFAAAASAVAAIFIFRQKSPLFGPDGVALLAAAASWGYYAIIEPNGAGYLFSLYPILHILFILLVLLAARELWGWILARLSLSWCLLRRIARRIPKPQAVLLGYAGWLIAIFMGIGLLPHPYLLTILMLAGAAALTLLCLWKYGADLNHLQKQLSNFREGLPITVREGAFSKAEEQLLHIQAQHEAAVHTAVTSERFKVELISNVSHDLRTPLTSILGYSELLQKENLSPEGQEQLQRLHLKAGYMNDLVEALFELTKVSSGVVPGKKEKLDLVRLLEQTIGLFDDQLISAGLAVRRSYEQEAVPVITDGARMHQVFANLLGNAIKYALPGTRIYLEVKEREQSQLIRMVNTASYEMDFQADEIMQRFARGDKARSTKGSGLGLAIAQTYTESVGGKFHVAVDGDQFSAVVELPKP